MNNLMHYKGYYGHVTFDNEAEIFHGEVIGLKDVITFQGKSVQELNKAFKDSVNDYLAWCQERNEKPEKTFSGNLRIRIPAELHAILTNEAASHGLSLNSYIIEKLQK
ncbi:type II toxin-antitoxin system HicB family antitoxin [Candidatus Babeliales bacterium]|nr:type II toxin-antitoxin system HicB family antitoxin [Candidatus Babeliales bacterium]